MSENKSESFKVGSGRYQVTVYLWKNSRGSFMWRFRRIDGTGKKIQRKIQAQARKAANDHLKKMREGDSLLEQVEQINRSLLAEILTTLPTRSDLEEFRQWRDQKSSSRSLGTLCADYLAFKVLEKGMETKHLKDVKTHLESLIKHLGADTPLIKITTTHLSTWMSTRMTKRDDEGKATQLGPSRYNNVRAAAVALWNWTHKQGELTVDQSKTASRLPTQYIAAKDSIRYATNDEALIVLKSVKKEFRLTVVLGLFAGLRPEEAAPRKGEKTGLDRSAISLERKVIYVSREVAKGAKRPARTIPITPCLAAWLKWTDLEEITSGPVAAGSLADARETIRIGKVLNEYFDRQEGWPHDWLRHTYGTNRNAILRSLHQVSEEMGTSVDMMEEHYHQPIEKSAGNSYFSLRPIDLQKERITHHKFTA